MAWKQEAFDEACQKFQDFFSDFKTFERPGTRYVKDERVHKDDLFTLYDDEVRDLVTKDPSDFFRAYVEILRRPLRTYGEKQNFIFRDHVNAMYKFDDSDSSKFGQILRLVIDSNGSPESIADYSEAASLFRESHPKFKSSTNPAALRDIVSLLLMLHDPKEFMFNQFSYWNDSAQQLLGEPLIKWGSHMTKEEFVNCQGFAKRVFAALEAKNFCPKDMVDVQSFLYRAGKPIWNQRAFESNIEEFKQRYPRFETFEKCGENYLSTQHRFKLNIRKKYNTFLRPLIESNPSKFFAAYVEVVNAYITHRPDEFSGWRALTDHMSNETKARFGTMLQSLVNDKSSKADWHSIIAEYDGNSNQLSESGILNADSHQVRETLRECATFLLALQWPKKYVHAVRRVWNSAGEQFLGHELIKFNDGISVELLEGLVKFTRQINNGLIAADLLPKGHSDKFHIHSFLWSVYDHAESRNNRDIPNDNDVTHNETVVHRRPDLTKLVQEIRSKGMRVEESVVRQYDFSMRTRGFVILAGPSGVGKTWLSSLYANAVNANYLVAPVAPNWSTNEDLLGFFNPIDGEFHATRFLRFIDEAAELWNRVGSSAKEFHLVLDEMNLARVEHYFSLFLSLMERRRETEIPETRLTGNRVVRIPPNLKFAGTVNMDETTHGFADKVFDRAQLIELSISPDAAREHVSKRIGETPAAEVLLDLWDRMAPACPVGFRVLDEIADYLKLADQEDVNWREALDEQIVSKLLPKLRGIDPEVAEVLKLIETRVNGEFPKAAAKCQSMLRRMQSTDVVSFF